MMEDKILFLKEEFVPLLRQLQPATQPAWGKMDAQQMVEHLRNAFKVANGKFQVTEMITTDTAHLEKLQAFIMTDKPFRENTKSPALPDEPLPKRFDSLSTAIDKMEEELKAVFAVYEANPELEILNPVFGKLNFHQQVALLYKHVTHHLHQFGLKPHA